MKVKLNKNVAIIFFIFTLLGREKLLFSGYTSAVIHECAHLLSSLILGVRAEKIVLGIEGMKLEIQKAPNIKKHMIILLSGPVCSFILFGALFMLRSAGIHGFELLEFASLCIGIVNLFPIIPLDGGAMVKLFLQSKLGIMYGSKLIRRISFTFTFILALLCTFLIFSGVGNISLICFILFLAFVGSKEKVSSLYEKKTVLSGETGKKKKAKYFAFSSDDTLFYMASKISPSYYLVGAVFSGDRFIGEIDEESLLSAIETLGTLESAESLFKIRQRDKTF